MTIKDNQGVPFDFQGVKEGDSVKCDVFGNGTVTSKYDFWVGPHHEQSLWVKFRQGGKVGQKNYDCQGHLLEINIRAVNPTLSF